jgi:2-polyprenyl-6-methoxyphenol hydroxylase-like FAD-dependent oxidoreductase
MNLWCIVVFYFTVTSTAAAVLKGSSVVIVGAGPAGLAAALMLSSHGVNDITVIEKRSSTSFEYERAYSYMLAPNGLRIMKYLNLTSKIASRSAVTADFTTLTVVKPTAEVQVITVPLRSRGKDKYWLPRPDLLDVLLDRIQEVNIEAKKKGERAPITMLFNGSCSTFGLSSEGGTIGVRLSHSGTERSINASILIGCDGVNSGKNICNPT